VAWYMVPLCTCRARDPQIHPKSWPRDSGHPLPNYNNGYMHEAEHIIYIITSDMHVKRYNNSDLPRVKYARVSSFSDCIKLPTRHDQKLKMTKPRLPGASHTSRAQNVFVCFCSGVSESEWRRYWLHSRLHSW
jgi:hypothetical protein